MRASATLSTRYTDDTRMASGRRGNTAFLMSFETDEATVYGQVPKHRNEEVREVVPSD